MCLFTDIDVHHTETGRGWTVPRVLGYKCRGYSKFVWQTETRLYTQQHLSLLLDVLYAHLWQNLCSGIRHYRSASPSLRTMPLDDTAAVTKNSPTCFCSLWLLEVLCFNYLSCGVVLMLSEEGICSWHRHKNSKGHSCCDLIDLIWFTFFSKWNIFISLFYKVFFFNSSGQFSLTQIYVLC